MTKRGRPAKTLSDLPEGWQERILALAKGGGGDASVLAEQDKGKLHTVAKSKNENQITFISERKQMQAEI